MMSSLIFHGSCIWPYSKFPSSLTPVDRKEIGSKRQWNVWLRWHPACAALVIHQLLPPWQLSTTTYCRQSCCLLANVIRHIEAYETSNNWPYDIIEYIKRICNVEVYVLVSHLNLTFSLSGRCWYFSRGLLLWTIPLWGGPKVGTFLYAL